MTYNPCPGKAKRLVNQCPYKSDTVGKSINKCHNDITFLAMRMKIKDELDEGINGLNVLIMNKV